MHSARYTRFREYPRAHTRTRAHTRAHTHTCIRGSGHRLLSRGQGSGREPGPQRWRTHLPLAVRLHQLAQRGVSLDFELHHGAVLPGHLEVDVVVLGLHALLQAHTRPRLSTGPRTATMPTGRGTCCVEGFRSSSSVSGSPESLAQPLRLDTGRSQHLHKSTEFTGYELKGQNLLNDAGKNPHPIFAVAGLSQHPSTRPLPRTSRTNETSTAHGMSSRAAALLGGRGHPTGRTPLQRAYGGSCRHRAQPGRSPRRLLRPRPGPVRGGDKDPS